MRRAAAVDRNQAEIVAAFRVLGCSVRTTHQVGRGFPDIAVGVSGRTYLVEIKDGSLSPSRRKLTPDEDAFVENWRGHVCIVETVDDVARLVGEWRNDSTVKIPMKGTIS